jgi:hypothetical protein
MKKFTSIFMLVLMLVFVGCSSSKVIDGKTYKPYGLINEGERKDPNIEYKLCVGNLVWGCLLINSIIVPIYFFGFDIMEPVGEKEK